MLQINGVGTPAMATLINLGRVNTAHLGGSQAG